MEQTSKPPARSAAHADSGAWLTEAERSPPSLTPQDSLYQAVDVFQADTELRLLPIVDAARRPVGAVFEKDVRRLLLNPFGHALLRNPAYGHGIARHLKPCPVAEATHDATVLMDAYRAANGSEGMILTRGGRLFAVLGNRRLVHLAAEREIEAARSRILRAQRIEQASERFEAQAAQLARAMGELSGQIERNAGATAERAGAVGDRAVAVASAAAQTSHNMGEVADRGRELVGALGGIGGNASGVRRAAADAVTLVTAGNARARELLRSAQSIDSVIALISAIARHVNLLALNATIEAARAGEAGRGFTVVANEVKQLSTQAGSAAAQITAHVREIRQGIDEVASGHDHVTQAIEAIEALASDVQRAVDAQEGATRRIAGNVEEAVEASTGIRHDVEAIGGTSRAASESARDMSLLAKRLQTGAEALSRQVDTFLGEIRAA